MADYIPATDGDFNAWQGNFVTYANANLAALGLVAGDTAPLVAPQGIWTANFVSQVAAQAAAQAATQNKDTARAAYEAVIRPLVKRLQASAAVSPAEKGALGITIPDTTRTPVGVPTTRPVATITSGQRLQHTINFTDSATPTARSKPAGAMGAEIWVAVLPVGTATPTDPAVFRFVALDTKTPYTLDFDAADGGKNAHYILRWVNTTGQKGPWSETVTATVGA